MNLMHLTLLEQAVFVLAALVVLLSFSLLAQARLLTGIHIFAWQGAVLAAATGLIAATSNEPHLFISAALTFILKVLAIPWMLHRLVRRLELERHADPLPHPALVMMAGAGLVIFSYWVVAPIEQLELAGTFHQFGGGVTRLVDYGDAASGSDPGDWFYVDGKRPVSSCRRRYPGNATGGGTGDRFRCAGGGSAVRRVFSAYQREYRFARRGSSEPAFRTRG